MIGEARRNAIAAMLKREGFVSSSWLQHEFKVSDITIRRDLDKLALQGILERVHGGARSISNADGASQEAAFHERVHSFQGQKKAIGQRAAMLVDEGSSIFLDGSTTVVHMAQFLESFKKLTVVTDSLAVLQALAHAPGVELVVLGGSLQADGNTIDGPFAMENAEQIRVDALFFSCSGLDAQGVYNPGTVGTHIKRLLIAKAKRRVLLASSEKYGLHDFYLLCSLADIDVIVTDAPPAPDAEAAFSRQGIELLIAGVGRSYSG